MSYSLHSPPRHSILPLSPFKLTIVTPSHNSTCTFFNRSADSVSAFILQHLVRLGYRVWFDQDDVDAMTPTRQNAIIGESPLAARCVSSDESALNVTCYEI